MAKKENAEEKIIAVESALSRTEQFFEKHYKLIGSIVGGIAILVLLYFGYMKYIKEPQELEAQAALFNAQKYFEADSLNKALNGDGVNLGFLSIADEFGSTKAGNLSHYYAGVIYLKLGDFDNAISELESFSSKDIIVSSMANGLLGDAYMEKNDIDNGIKYYLASADNNKNSFTTPMYLFRAALAYELQNKWQEASDLYLRIQKDYFRSMEARDIDKYIARANAKLNKE